MNIENVHQLLRGRKSVYPPQFIDQEISRKIIEEILESANWAPTHKLTDLWRYKIFHGKSQKQLGNFMAEKYRATIPEADFSISRYDKLKTNPVKAGCVLAICVQRDHLERVPEWEELASVACSVHSIWLAASAYNIGGYWSTPAVIESLNELVPMNSGEKCVGLFYMGYYQPFEANRKRGDWREKVIWVEG